MREKLEIKMTLESDVIFGNGLSTPGGEDISIQYDVQGFPYYRGVTFKGVFKEEFERYMDWTGNKNKDTYIKKLFGESGNDELEGEIIFSNFQLSDYVKQEMLKEIGNKPTEIVEVLTNNRTFTKLEQGMVKDGSLRVARCVNKGLIFYSNLICDTDDKNTIVEVLGLVKWIGTMRNRGFGKVKIEVIG